MKRNKFFISFKFGRIGAFDHFKRTKNAVNLQNKGW